MISSLIHTHTHTHTHTTDMKLRTIHTSTGNPNVIEARTISISNVLRSKNRSFPVRIIRLHHPSTLS